jgi:NodT family efflux transporter outer membrane factor (OMF) lipoprotein
MNFIANRLNTSLILLLLVPTGCMVGPNYQPPPAPMTLQWIDYATSPIATPEENQAAFQQWWTVFDDPVLNSLISDSYGQNLSLRAAGQRVMEARAVRGIAVGNLFPQTQELAGGYTRTKASDQTVNNGNGDQWFSESQVGFNLTWELDFWGRFRRSIEAADATLEASIANYDDVVVVLLSDVAATYIQYRTFQERLFYARENLRIQEAGYQLSSDKFRMGAVTERDAQQAKQIVEQTRSRIPDLEAGLRRANNALCVLLGMPPQLLADRLGESGVIPQGNPQLELGIPAELLRRRPDVRRAEREAAAQSAAIGVAVADLYPRFSLTGSIGLRAEDLDDLGRTPGSLSGFGGPIFQWDLLNYGRLRNAVQAQEARYRQAALNYQDAVLRANREAEDAIISYLKSQERTRYLNESVIAAQRTVQITNDQYNQGVIDFTPVFLFEATLTSQQDDLAVARGDIALSLVDLYRSLGGGWEAQQDPHAFDAPVPPAPTTQRAPTPMPTTLPAPRR